MRQVLLGHWWHVEGGSIKVTILQDRPNWNNLTLLSACRYSQIVAQALMTDSLSLSTLRMIAKIKIQIHIDIDREEVVADPIIAIGILNRVLVNHVSVVFGRNLRIVLLALHLKTWWDIHILKGAA